MGSDGQKEQPEMPALLAEEQMAEGTTAPSAMTPAVYMHKSGVASLSELSRFKVADPKGYTELRDAAIAEMTYLGIPVRENV